MPTPGQALTKHREGRVEESTSGNRRREYDGMRRCPHSQTWSSGPGPHWGQAGGRDRPEGSGSSGFGSCYQGSFVGE